jgi:DNA-binding NtrC family response regulator
MSGVPPVRSHNILLLDGDLRSTKRLASLLREDEFEVEVFGDGASAMERLALRPAPDTLVTELSVPLVDGPSVARFAVEQRPDMRIIVLTRYPNSLGRASFGVPSPMVLSKPLDYARLLELLGDTRPPSSGSAPQLLPSIRGC